MNVHARVFFFLTITISMHTSCKNENKESYSVAKDPIVKINTLNLLKKIPEGIKTPKGMIWIPGGVFYQGAVPQDTMAMHYEKPRHQVAVNGFFMDTTEVTNTKFKKFIEETGYITIAQREIDWEEMKKQLPPGTPRPHDSIMQPGSMIFKKTKLSISNFQDYSQWWQWTIGANWKHPYGPESSIEGKDDFPVVHIAYEDALAYCKWANRRLPTEAEWEYAARGKNHESIYFWGDDVSKLSSRANTWTGEFPVENNKKDGYELQSTVGQYAPNTYGLYDISGNVWEWTSDWYHIDYYKKLALEKDLVVDPKGAQKAYNPSNPYIQEKVIKGGSFLCSVSYCASYRLSAKMGASPDSSTDHIGFRTVVDHTMLSSDTKK